MSPRVLRRIRARSFSPRARTTLAGTPATSERGSSIAPVSTAPIPRMHSSASLAPGASLHLAAQVAEVADLDRCGLLSVVRPERRAAAADDDVPPERDLVGEIDAMAGRDHGSGTDLEHRQWVRRAVVVGDRVEQVEAHHVGVAPSTTRSPPRMMFSGPDAGPSAELEPADGDDRAQVADAAAVGELDRARVDQGDSDAHARRDPVPEEDAIEDALGEAG